MRAGGEVCLSLALEDQEQVAVDHYLSAKASLKSTCHGSGSG